MENFIRVQRERASSRWPSTDTTLTSLATARPSEWSRFRVIPWLDDLVSLITDGDSRWSPKWSKPSFPVVYPSVDLLVSF